MTLTPERFQRVRHLFEAALERTGHKRDAFLAEACADDPDLRREVDRLLEAHEATGTLNPLGVSPGWSAVADSASRSGHRLGAYEILRELGRGGMGSVYLARRADEAFRKNVAIKILRADAASADVIKRFHRERDILAELDHPNIARLMDAGQTEDGLPYFVMEYVEGSSIGRYADEARLSVHDRIALFRQVCDAVDYAHQHKIVHRDLKPGNVLVTATGQVKLLDFGIAGLLEKDTGIEGLTRAGMWLMTPEYASPEQVRGEAAGRASDVYSLGVILFELLTGHRPYHLKSRIFHEVVRIVCEEPPTKPSVVITQPIETTTADGVPSSIPAESTGRARQTSLDELRRQLSGDLDNILLKALDKQPTDRYASAQQLRADIDRHLQNEPVWARSRSVFYRLSRGASRYGAALVVIAAMAAAVATGAVQLSWSAMAWMAGAAAIIGLWQAATNPEIGQRFARTRWLFPVFVVAVMAGCISMGALLFRQGRGAGPRQTPWWANALWVLLPVVAWTFARRRAAGPLILNLTGTRSLTIRLVALVGAGLQIAANVRAAISPGLASKDWIQLVTTGLWLILMFVITWAEIRREGLLVGGTLIPWRRISSWSWESNKLVLHVDRRVKFLPPVRIPVRASQHDRVQAILVRELGAWPG